MPTVNTTIDTILMCCDDSVVNLQEINGFVISKINLSDFPNKSNITNGNGDLQTDYYTSQIRDDNNIFFISLHKEEKHDLQITPSSTAPLRFTTNDLSLSQELDDYTDNSYQGLLKTVNLLSVFKEGNIGVKNVFYKHIFTSMGLMNWEKKHTRINGVWSIFDNRLFTLSNPQEISDCKQFLTDYDQPYSLMENVIAEFIGAKEEIDDSTSVEQFSTVLEMTVTSKRERIDKKETVSKRVAALIGDSQTEKAQIYSWVRQFYKLRSDSQHFGDDRNITVQTVHEFESIARRVIKKYLEYTKINIARNPRLDWNAIKSQRIVELRNEVSVLNNQGVF